MKKLAFTLAEVLITLGIIGVVAAMTIPALNNHIKETKYLALFKEDFSILSNAMNLVISDGSDIYPKVVNNAAYEKKWFDDVLRKHLKITKECLNESGCWFEKDYGTGWVDNCRKAYVVVLNNGSSVCIQHLWGPAGYTRPADSGYPVVLQFTVDVNGPELPNRTGKDVFYFVFDPDKDMLIPAGQYYSDAELDEECLRGRKDTCAAWIMRHNWKMPK